MAQAAISEKGGKILIGSRMSNEPVDFFFSPLLWPANNIIQAVYLKDKKSAAKAPDAPPYLNLITHVSVMCGALRAFILAYFVIYWLSPYIQPSGRYPAFGGGEILSVSWILPILARNVLATWIICGSWDWFLYFSPLKEKLRPYKMNADYPSIEQIYHDAFWTTTATAVASGLEVLCCYCYCNHIFPSFGPEQFQFNWSSVAWTLLVTHWRLIHFYFIHRLMHPWRTTVIPDVGKLLYKHVHSLHHKSHNPTAFSGTSMHPLESLLYYSACLMPVPFGCHPCVMLACLVDLAMGAWTGHDGFQFPGAGDMYHYLHHAHFDCNYGTSIIPLDYLFGTSAVCKNDVKRIWKN